LGNKLFRITLLIKISVFIFIWFSTFTKASRAQFVLDRLVFFVVKLASLSLHFFGVFLQDTALNTCYVTLQLPLATRVSDHLFVFFSVAAAGTTAAGAGGGGGIVF